MEIDVPFDSLDTKQFFEGIFPDCYVCALRVDIGQIEGSKPIDEAGVFGLTTSDDYDSFFARKYFDLNKQGYGIHFTPNAVKVAEGKNRIDNIEYINSFWVEIDIEETKELKHEDDVITRKNIKAEIAGLFLNFDFKYWPSLFVETRNGFQVYWFAANCTILDFNLVQECLYRRFKNVGADKSSMKLNSMLRVPWFRYHKKGEEGFITPWKVFSTLRLYDFNEMVAFLSAEYDELMSEKKRLNYELFEQELMSRSVTLNNRWTPPKGQSKVAKIIAYPIKNLLEKLSGKEIVNGDKFTFKKVSDTKFAVMVNGHGSPNWIDSSTNMIFSNNKPKFWNMIHYLEFYTNDKTKAVDELSNLID